jgi:hypothetical protein
VTWLGVLVLCIPIGVAVVLIAAPARFAGMHVFENIRGGELRVNLVLLLLMLASQVALAAMLFLYLREMQKAAFRYRGSDSVVDRIGSWVATLSLVMFAALILYMGFVVAMFLGRFAVSAAELFEWGRVVLLSTFGMFFVLDALLWYSGARMAGEAARSLAGASTDAEKNAFALAIRRADNDRDLARSSWLLIDVPVLLLAFGALGLRWLMVRSGGYDVVFDRDFVSCGIEGTPSRELADLFGNGVDAGVTIGLMVFSQIEFVVLKGRWAFRR